MKVLSALLLLFLPFSYPAAHRGGLGQPQGAKAGVSLRLRGVDGKTYDIEQMRGSVILVSFGATWCLSCRGELAALEELKGEYAGRPVKLLWVNVEGAEEITDKELRDYAKELKLTLPVLRDPTMAAYSSFAARGPSPLKRSMKTPVPLLVFIDAAGRFAPPGHFGMTSPESYKAKVRARLDNLLSSPGAESAGGPR